MRKKDFSVLVKLLIKKLYIPTFKPKLFLINEWQFYFKNYEESDFEPTKRPNLKRFVH